MSFACLVFNIDVNVTFTHVFLNVPQVSSLKSRLKKVSTTTGDGVARAFLKSQASLFGSYRNALQIESVSMYTYTEK